MNPVSIARAPEDLVDGGALLPHQPDAASASTGATRSDSGIRLVLPEACMSSSARVNDRGYRVIWHEGKHAREHRVVFVRSRGLTLCDIKGLEVRHRCDNPSCVNPRHLEIGTHADNMRDMAERRRANPCRGSSHKLAKLTEQDIPIIRRMLASESQSHVARVFGVDKALIGRISRSQSWSHVA